METDTGLDHSGAVAPPTAPPYYTVGQLQAMRAEKDGKPCKSRNRPVLLKSLGLPDTPRPADMKHDGRRDGDVARNPSARQVKKAASKRVAAKVKKAIRTAPASRVKIMKPKAIKSTIEIVIRSDPDRHATALAYVKRAMSRKEPPSLRVLCEEMRKARVKKPRGGYDWWPSSVQNLMRQAGYDAGGKAGNK